MGKFETKGQVAGLFLGAAGVAFILILLVNAEARKRGLLLEEIEIDQSVQIDNPIKRSISESSEGTLRKITEYVRSFYSEHFEKTRRKRSIEDDEVNERNKIGDSILDETLHKNKIRHIDEKVRYLGKKNYLVQSILRVYGANENSESSVTIEDFHKFLNEDSNQEQNEVKSGSKHDMTDETENAFGIIKEDAESNVDTTVDTEDTNAKLVKANDTTDNVADANDNDPTNVHSPLLEENVFEDVHSALKSATKSCSVNGSLLMVIGMTTMVNMMLVLITLAFIRLYRHYKRLHSPQDKIWLCQEDDISRYYEEDIEPKLGPIVIT